jgi:hypothetical protein
MLTAVRKLWKNIVKGYMPEEPLILKKEFKNKKKFKKVKRLRKK